MSLACSSKDWPIRLAVLTGLCLTACLLQASPAHAQFSYAEDDTDCNGDVVDPMTVSFIGSGATIRKLAGYERGGPFQDDIDGDITIHTRSQPEGDWVRHNTDNRFRQNRSYLGECSQNPDDSDLASAFGFGNDRWHLRMFAPYNVAAYDGGSIKEVEMTPHREEWTTRGDCGRFDLPGADEVGNHAVIRGAVNKGDRYRERRGSGFDRARRFLQATYGAAGGSRHHNTKTYPYGNTQSVRQCTGEYAGSNGTYLKIGIGRRQCQASKNPFPGCEE